MTQPQQPPGLQIGKLPGWHIAMGLSGWILYLFVAHPVTMVVAIILSILAVPRFVRGPWEKADKRITEKLSRPQRPSKRVAHIMLDTEKLLWEAADHPISLLGWYLCWILATAAAWALLVYVTLGQWFLWTVLILWILCMLWVLLKTIILRRNRLCLTDKRVMVVYGLFTTNHEMMPLSKMTNEQLEIPWHSNLLSWLRIISTQYGTMKPDSAGEEGRLGHVKFIQYAIQVNRIVMERALG